MCCCLDESHRATLVQRISRGFGRSPCLFHPRSPPPPPPSLPTTAGSPPQAPMSKLDAHSNSQPDSGGGGGSSQSAPAKDQSATPRVYAGVFELLPASTGWGAVVGAFCGLTNPTTPNAFQLCFLNAALQVLMNTAPLTEWLRTHPPTEDCTLFSLHRGNKGSNQFVLCAQATASRRPSSASLASCATLGTNASLGKSLTLQESFISITGSKVRSSSLVTIRIKINIDFTCDLQNSARRSFSASSRTPTSSS